VIRSVLFADIFKAGDELMKIAEGSMFWMRRCLALVVLVIAFAGCAHKTETPIPLPTQVQPLSQKPPSATPAFSIGSPDARVRVEAFYPLDEKHKSLLQWLHQAGSEFGKSLYIQFFDITTEAGERVWHQRGMKCGGILINGNSCFTLGSRRITLLRDPTSASWSRDDLFAVLRAEIERSTSQPSATEARGEKAQTPASKTFTRGKSLFMFCAAAFRKPVERLCAQFEKEFGIPVRVCYAGSACLLGQIEISRRGDLYLAGEEWYMDQARRRGFLEKSANLCYMIPVIMVKKGNPKRIRSLNDLSRPDLRLGMGEPKSCAIGKSTVDLLRKHNLYEKVVRNVVVHTGTAPELGSAMKLGNIDAAINWDAVAVWYGDACDIVPIPRRDNLVVECSLGVLTFSKAKRLAEQFLSYASGAAGKKIFAAERFTTDLRHPIYSD